MRRPLPTLVLLAVLLPLTTRALDWEHRTATAVTAPFQKSLVLTFPFKNTSGSVSTLKDIATNCDCVTATLDRSSYAPGQTGKLTAVFAVGERYGRYERTITVTTSDTAEPAKLTVLIDSPEIVVPTPRTVDWVIGSAGKPQTVDLVVEPGVRMVFAEHFAINDSFLVTLEEVEAGRRYRLRISPRSTALPANTAIRVVGNDKAGHRLVVSAYANVK